MTNPYPCNRETSGGRIIYSFETDQKVRYQAYFSDYNYMFGSVILDCDFYTFDLVVVGDYVRPPKYTATDSRIEHTVQWCFEEIFKDIYNIVVCVYDSSDGSEWARKRKFDSWADKADIDYIERFDFEVPDEDYNLLSSVFLHLDFPDKESVLNRYQQVMENGNMPLN